MEDIVQLENQIYIKASSTLADQRLRVLKQGEAFGIFDVYGDIKPVGLGTQGLYLGSTRFLSRFELRLGGRYPTLLSSSITRDDLLLIADLSNPDIPNCEGKSIKHSAFHIQRTKFLSEDSCFEEIEITNFSDESCCLPVTFFYQGDFVDMFEIRGVQREKHGRILPVKCERSSVVLSYVGADGKTRACRIHFDPAPQEIADSQCRYLFQVPAKEAARLHIAVNCYDGPFPGTEARPFPEMLKETADKFAQRVSTSCGIHSSSERYNSWFERSRADTLLMTTDTSYGFYPYAGIPWFNTIFGRDGIITALQYLWADSRIARDVLSCLASLQAKADSELEDAEPGKILHELRKGEMVDTGEIPFKRYYGSVDSTPLFILLAGRYLETTGDLPFLEKLWPAVQAGLEWIDRYGDRDGDGFVEYRRRSPRGLTNQGWKDSHDSVSHADGRLAEGPIALAEVQGYVYDAKVQAAGIARRLGKADLSTKLLLEAEDLRRKFLACFWKPDLDCFALALDGEKKTCDVVSSNAGQCLFSGIAEPTHAERLARRLFQEDMFSGWGIRTLSSRARRYNPMSYHNGSVWPHDNSLIAEGFARYGLKDEVVKLTEALFDVAVNVDLLRLPELFCGFQRRERQGPTLYPVACSPQAWAAGSAFLLLQACLGIKIDAFAGVVLLNHPALPANIHRLTLQNLNVGQGQVDLFFRRHGSEVSVYVERRTGKVEVSILK